MTMCNVYNENEHICYSLPNERCAHCPRHPYMIESIVLDSYNKGEK